MKTSIHKRSIQPRFIHALTVGAVLFGVVGCTQRQDPIVPVKVGLLVPEGSESLGAIAQAWKQAAILAKEQINAAGGLYDGRPMVLEIRDTEASATIAADGMRELIEEDVVGVIGPATSGESLATRDLADQLYLGLFAGWGAPVETLPTVQKVSHETLLQLGSPAES